MILLLAIMAKFGQTCRLLISSVVENKPALVLVTQSPLGSLVIGRIPRQTNHSARLIEYALRFGSGA